MAQPIDPNSPHYRFHPDSIGWLHRRHENGEEITAADLDRLLAADPGNGADPVMIHYLREHLNGRLKKKRGRKPPPISRPFVLMVVADAIRERADEIKAERKRAGRYSHRGALEPAVLAADEIGKRFGLPGGSSLINAISSQKNLKKKVKSKPKKA